MFGLRSAPAAAASPRARPAVRHAEAGGGARLPQHLGLSFLQEPAHVVPPTSSHPRAPGSPPSAPQRAAGLMIPRAGPFCPVGRGRGRRQAPCARSWRDVAVATGGSVPHRLLARAGSAAGARPLRFLGQLFSPALRARFSSWSPPQRGLSDPLVQTVVSFHFKALLVSPRFSAPGPSLRPLGRPIPPLLVVNLPEFTSDKSISVLPAGNNPNLNN